jgi:hypothetical protein
LKDIENDEIEPRRRQFQNSTSRVLDEYRIMEPASEERLHSQARKGIVIDDKDSTHDSLDVGNRVPTIIPISTLASRRSKRSIAQPCTTIGVLLNWQ